MGWWLPRGTAREKKQRSGGAAWLATVGRPASHFAVCQRPPAARLLPLLSPAETCFPNGKHLPCDAVKRNSCGEKKRFPLSPAPSTTAAAGARPGPAGGAAPLGTRHCPPPSSTNLPAGRARSPPGAVRAPPRPEAPPRPRPAPRLPARCGAAAHWLTRCAAPVKATNGERRVGCGRGEPREGALGRRGRAGRPASSRPSRCLRPNLWKSSFCSGVGVPALGHRCFSPRRSTDEPLWPAIPQPLTSHCNFVLTSASTSCKEMRCSFPKGLEVGRMFFKGSFY